MQEILSKYNDDVLKNLDKDNMHEIIGFLQRNNCDYIEELISDYLDLFTIEYEEFINKFMLLNQKYNYEFLKKASEDMNLLEEFWKVETT